MNQGIAIKSRPRFARFPCQTSTRSGDLTRPGREPAPTRPCQMRANVTHRPGRLGSGTVGRPGRRVACGEGGWPPKQGSARMRSGKCRALPRRRGEGAGGRSASEELNAKGNREKIRHAKCLGTDLVPMPGFSTGARAWLGVLLSRAAGGAP